MTPPLAAPLAGPPAPPGRRGARLHPDVADAVRTALLSNPAESWASIGRRCGTSTRTVARAARKLGQGVRPRVRPADSNLAEAIKLRLAEGWRQAHVAAFFGCTAAYVSKVARRAGEVET